MELNNEIMEYTTEQLDELLEMVNGRQFRQLKSILVEWNEADIAEFLEEVSDQLGPDRGVLIFRMLPKALAVEVFAFLPADNQGNIINGMTDAELRFIVEELYVDDAVDMLEELPATVVRRVLENATPETRAIINQFLNYPENSAGSIMTAEYLALKKNMTVANAIDYIRLHGQDKETIYTLFVTDARRHLEGVVSVKDLLMNDYATLVGDIMDDNVIKATTTDDQEDVADMFTKYDLLSMAVVDQENRLVGIVTVDDAVDVIEEEVTEDIEKMAAIIPTDKPYLKTTTWEAWKARFPWLLLMMVSATFSGQIITSFEDSLAACVVLSAFIPMLMGTGGNGGSQSSVSVIRALSLGDVEFSDLLRVMWKEVRVSIFCGITLAAVNFVKMLLVDGLLFNNPDITPMVALVVCVALFFTIVCAKVVGAALPILADKIGLDPAVMASPIITTIVDIISLLIYFQTAKLVLGL